MIADAKGSGQYRQLGPKSLSDLRTSQPHPGTMERGSPRLQSPLGAKRGRWGGGDIALNYRFWGCESGEMSVSHFGKAQSYGATRSRTWQSSPQIV